MTGTGGDAEAPAGGPPADPAGRSPEPPDESEPSAPDLSPEALRAVADAIAPQFPAPFDETELVLLDVDPHRVHAYWHVSASELEAARERAGRNPRAPLVLRMQDVTPDGEGTPGHWEPFDLEVQGLDSHCYVDLWQDGRAYEAQLGVRATDGTLVALARSNRIETPPASPERVPRAAAPPAPPAPAAAVSEVERQDLSSNPVPADVEALPTEAPAVPTEATGPLDDFPPAAWLAAPASTAPAEAPLTSPRTASGTEAPAPSSGTDETRASPWATPTDAGEDSAVEVALQVPAAEGLHPEFPNPAPETAPAMAAGPTDGALEAVLDGALLPLASDGGGATIGDTGVTVAEAAGTGAEAAGTGGEAAGNDGETAPDHTRWAEPLVTYSSATLAGQAALLELSVELHVFGRARPGSRLQLFGRPVALRPDGSFSVRRPLPAGAVVLPLRLDEPEPGEATPD